MPTVAIRVRQIAGVEGFDIVVKQDKQPVSLSTNNLMVGYPYEKAASSGWTVGEWRQKRFQTTYDDLTCDVLLENGSTAKGQMKLSRVRASYEE